MNLQNSYLNRIFSYMKLNSLIQINMGNWPYIDTISAAPFPNCQDGYS